MNIFHQANSLKEGPKAEHHGHYRVSYSMFSQMFGKIFLETINELQVKKNVVYDDADLPALLIIVVNMEVSNFEIAGNSSLKV